MTATAHSSSHASPARLALVEFKQSQPGLYRRYMTVLGPLFDTVWTRAVSNGVDPIAAVKREAQREGAPA